MLDESSKNSEKVKRLIPEAEVQDKKGLLTGIVSIIYVVSRLSS